MLITVVMAGHDPNARSQFDALLKTVRARPAYSIPASSGGPYLMDWRLTADGSSTDAAGGGWNAMDGDLDIAMALLMADKQWGSTGAWNYRQEGINTINAMKAFNMKPDGTTKGMATPNVSRTSDYMIGHFRAFARATGDSYWSTTVIDRCYALINRMQTVYSPSAGLMPDFIVATDTSTPYPSPGGMGDFTATEMNYFANAQRNPWRWGCDYVLSGDTRWKSVLNKMTAFFKADTGGDPARTAIGYEMSGNALQRPYPAWTPKGMIGPQLCGAMADSAHQAYLNALWTYNANNFSVQYYDAELQLLPMLVASGNWWTV
jgi:endo-1,4-beta-D-glucanase Y